MLFFSNLYSIFLQSLCKVLGKILISTTSDTQLSKLIFPVYYILENSLTNQENGPRYRVFESPGFRKFHNYLLIGKNNKTWPNSEQVTNIFYQFFYFFLFFFANQQFLSIFLPKFFLFLILLDSFKSKYFKTFLKEKNSLFSLIL